MKADYNENLQYRVSVAMAAYNGEKYISKQIDSILMNLKENDELIISYDLSKDTTWKIINEYKKKDSRVKVFRNENTRGVQGNFENALSKTSGEFIFLSDQDDIWVEDKVEKTLNYFEDKNAILIIHDGYMVNSNCKIINKSMFKLGHATISIFGNYIKGTLWGCCMAFRAEVKEWILPFPNRIPHDLWTAIVCKYMGKVVLLNEKLIKHRVHKNNVTAGRRKINIIIWERIRFGKSIICRFIKLKLKK